MGKAADGRSVPEVIFDTADGAHINDANPLAVKIVGAGSGTPVEGTITVGGTAQLVFGATPTNGWEIVNLHATETLYARENGAATAASNAASIPILANGSYTTPLGYKPTGDVSVIAATTGHAFIARRW